MQIAKATYLILGNLPPSQKFGLVSQISRCAISGPSNIAEGSSRSSNEEFAHFLSIALSSLFELETNLLLSIELGLIKADLEDLLSSIIQLEKKISTFKKNTIIKYLIQAHCHYSLFLNP